MSGTVLGLPMSKIAVWGNIVTPETVVIGGFILITNDCIDGIITNLGPEHASYIVCAEHKDHYILPGFVDIHNHGMVGGTDVLEHWLHPEENLRHFAKHGTTSVLASIIFSSSHPKLVENVINATESCCGSVIPNAAILEGIHAEGPIIASPGGLPPCPNLPLQAFKDLCATMPHMKIMTISPSKESEVSYERLRHLLEIGVRPSLGHDRKASEGEILGALQLAAKYNVQLHSTHVYNVMAFHHTNISLANFVLVPKYPALPRYANCVPPTVEMIADNIHVHPLAATTVLSTRNVHSDVCVISDCIQAHNPGERVKYNGRWAVVRAEGAAYLSDSQGQLTTTLAGGTASVSEMFHLLCTQYGMGLVAASKMVSANPAAVARMDRVGSIAKGRYANLVCVGVRLDMIEGVMIRGRWAQVEKTRILKPRQSNL